MDIAYFCKAVMVMLIINLNFKGYWITSLLGIKTANYEYNEKKEELK